MNLRMPSVAVAAVFALIALTVSACGNDSPPVATPAAQPAPFSAELTAAQKRQITLDDARFNREQREATAREDRQIARSEQRQARSERQQTPPSALEAAVADAIVGQQAKLLDSSAKSNARNAVSQMESCLTEDDYATCAGNSDVTSLASPSGVDAFNYVLTASSKSGNTFTIAKTGGEYERACTGSSGGCQGGSW